MKVRQCELRSGSTVLTAWLEDRLKVGNVVTLKNRADDRDWTVTRISEPPVSLESIDRAWNVGGITSSR